MMVRYGALTDPTPKAEIVAALNSAANHMKNLARSDLIKAPDKLRLKWEREAHVIRQFLLDYDSST